jgi:hypothetical protein
MGTRLDMATVADVILSADESEEPIAEWTLDELDHCADLDSVRSAWSRSDGPGF